MTADGTIRRASINIKVLGVGGGGNSVLLRIAEDRAINVELIGINTDKKMLARLEREGINTITIGERLTGGRGTGSNVMFGTNAALNDQMRLQKAMEGADIVFVTAGMGAGTGTGASPVIAKIARELGILSVGVVTIPFSWEGKRKRMVAEQGINLLKSNMDALITVKNDNLLKLPQYHSMSLSDAFKAADNVLRQAIECISETILTTGVVNVDFADVRTIFRQSRQSDVFWGIGEDETGSVINAVKKAISSPLIERPLRGARGVVLNITGGESLSLYEVNEASMFINKQTHPEVNLVFGTVIVPGMGQTVKSTLIATDFEGASANGTPLNMMGNAFGQPGGFAPAPAVNQAPPRQAAAMAQTPVVNNVPNAAANQAAFTPNQPTRQSQPGDGLSLPSFMGNNKSPAPAAEKSDNNNSGGFGHISMPRWSDDGGKK